MTLADRVSQGAVLDAVEARAFLDGPDLIAIGMMADDVRRRLHGARTSFVRVLESHVDAPVTARPAGLAAGEIRIVGRPATLEAAVDAVRAAAGIAQGEPVSGFLLSDLIDLATAEGRPLADLCAQLAAAGLEEVAGVPIDLVADPAEAVRTARTAGLHARRIVVQALAADGAIDLCLRARSLQDAVGDFAGFAPLPTTMSMTEPTTGYDDVKQVALARVMVQNVPSVQVDWAAYGPKLAQVALTMGADDLDRVAAVETGVLGPRRSALEEIRNNLRAAALEGAERNARWDPIGL